MSGKVINKGSHLLRHRQRMVNVKQTWFTLPVKRAINGVKLVFNEIFAFLIPPMLVLGLRLFIDPIGWQSWSEVTNLEDLKNIGVQEVVLVSETTEVEE